MTPLFDRKDRHREDEILGSSDGAAQALSEAVVENDFVERVYGKLASVYDLAFGPALNPGRVRAIQCMALGEGERILEVGVGTGINIGLYPSYCRVTGIDLSSHMLGKAHERIARKGLEHARLFQMDAADLEFSDDSFDVVYAPYLISVVPDPVKVAQEMHRVCRPRGLIIFLSHFLSGNPIISYVERLISPLTIHVGFKADLDLYALLAQAGLRPVSIEKVNFPPIWSIVTCEK